MLALNIHLLLGVFSGIHFIDAEDITAHPMTGHTTVSGIISTPSPVPAGQNHSAEASNVMISTTLITTTPRPSKQTTKGHPSALAEGKSKSASTSATVDPGSREVGSPTLSPVPAGINLGVIPAVNTPGASKAVTSTKAFSDQSTGPAPSLPDPAPTEEKSALTMAAFGVISFIVILVVVVIFLVCVVSLRFKCNRSKDAEDKQKPESMVSESCSAATAKKNSITLISMKNLSMNNSMSYPTSEKVL